MIGIPAGELIGRKVMDMYPPEDAATLRNRILQRQTDGHSQYEFYLPQAGGGRLPVLVTARQIEDPDGNVFAVITATDITEQKRAENALREANAQLEKRHQDVTHGNALEHPVNAPVIKLIMIRKSVKKQPDGEERDPPPKNVLEHFPAARATIETRGK